jgi:hypothetical protein
VRQSDRVTCPATIHPDLHVRASRSQCAIVPPVSPTASCFGGGLALRHVKPSVGVAVSSGAAGKCTLIGLTADDSKGPSVRASRYPLCAVVLILQRPRSQEPFPWRALHHVVRRYRHQVWPERSGLIAYVAPATATHTGRAHTHTYWANVIHGCTVLTRTLPLPESGKVVPSPSRFIDNSSIVEMVPWIDTHDVVRLAGMDYEGTCCSPVMGCHHATVVELPTSWWKAKRHLDQLDSYWKTTGR